MNNQNTVASAACKIAAVILEDEHKGLDALRSETEGFEYDQRLCAWNTALQIARRVDGPVIEDRKCGAWNPRLMGTKGGKSTSAAKQAASRSNGAKGGRPTTIDWTAYQMRYGLSLEEMDEIAKQVGIDMQSPFVTPAQARAFNELCAIAR